MGLLAKGNLIRYQIVLVCGDIIIALAILIITDSCLPEQSHSPIWVYLFMPAILMVSYVGERYQTSPLKNKTKLFIILFILTGTGLFLTNFFEETDCYYTALLICLAVFVLLQTCWHFIVHYLYNSMLLEQRVLVIGTGPLAEKVEKLILADSGSYSLLGYIATPKDLLTVDENQIVGNMQNILDTAMSLKANFIVIALTEKRGNLIVEKLIPCKLNGIRIFEFPSFYEILTGKLPIEDINPSWLVHSEGFLVTPLKRLAKRCFDIFACTLLLLFVSPLILPIIIIIRLVSPGSPFYFQERVGLHGKHFTMYKFRSMDVDAEKETGPVMNTSIDSDRIFPFGAFMRKTRIDELPQLINVLKGDMSFIGPRPERPTFVKLISESVEYYPERHAVKPGLTGWAQVMFRYGSNIGDSKEKLRYDLYYINNMSFVLDLLITLETIKVVLFRKGSQ